MRAHHQLGRLLAAAALVAAAVGLGTPAPAVAAGCSTASGVSVVVDFNQLGGGVSSSCVTGGGGQTASALFPAAGRSLTYAQRQPGFVCRVAGKPAEDPCVNTSPSNAFWGLWWTDDKGGDWIFSSLGASSLKIPDGGYVAFSWDEVGGSAKPSADPAAHSSPSPAPTPSTQPQPPPQPSQPSPGNNGGGNGNGDGGKNGGSGDAPSPGGKASPAAPQPSTSGSAASNPSASAAPGAPARPGKPGKPGKPSASGDPSTSSAPSVTPSEEASGDTSVSDDPVSPLAADAEDDGLPAWVAPALILVVFGGAGVVFLLRRRQMGP